MIRKLSCLLVLAATAAACGTADPEDVGSPDPIVNALEASGAVEFYVRLVGANGAVFRGETTNERFLGTVPAIRYFSDVNRSSGTGTRCTAFRFTKVAGEASPQIVGAVASGETLQSVRMEFVRTAPDGILYTWQKVDLSGFKLSMVQQAVAPQDPWSYSVILEEATLIPTATGTVTLTSFPQSGEIPRQHVHLREVSASSDWRQEELAEAGH